jgi:4-diphosphocytidyl-2-C-methyl-D-erythritol kinase
MLKKKSFAKINLYLEITGNDARGYHLLDSLIAYLDIFDEIEIKDSTSLTLKISGENGEILKEDNQENIIIKTVNLLAKKYHLDPKIAISLIKNIPVGAGLGGGSANAATILLMLNQFYNLNLSTQKLKEIGLQIGSDVPFCLHGKIAVVSGTGEIITDVKMKTPPIFALIINPRKTLLTKKVFDLFNQKYRDKIQEKSQHLLTENSDIISVIKPRQNYLEKPAIEFVPKIADILKTLASQENCAISRMSGSGATCFGLFKNENDLDLAYNNLQKKFPGFYIKKSKLLYKI